MAQSGIGFMFTIQGKRGGLEKKRRVHELEEWKGGGIISPTNLTN